MHLQVIKRKTGQQRTYFKVAGGLIIISSSGIDRTPEIKFANGKNMKLREAALDVNLQEFAENLQAAMNLLMEAKS